MFSKILPRTDETTEDRPGTRAERVGGADRRSLPPPPLIGDRQGARGSVPRLDAQQEAGLIVIERVDESVGSLADVADAQL